MSSILEAIEGQNPSYTWWSICWERDLIVNGPRWKIGYTVMICRFFKTRGCRGLTLFVRLLVSYLIMDTSWNQALIKEIFWPVDKDSILSVPLSARRRED